MVVQDGGRQVLLVAHHNSNVVLHALRQKTLGGADGRVVQNQDAKVFHRERLCSEFLTVRQANW